jgi:hypothetical protein
MLAQGIDQYIAAAENKVEVYHGSQNAISLLG